MVSEVLHHKSNSSCVSNHSSSLPVNMDNVVVTASFFVTSILAVVSAPSISSKDTAYGLVLSQISTSIGCADNSSLTIVVSCK